MSKPNHANLFAASDRGNPLGLATLSHGDLQDGTSPRCVLQAKLPWMGNQEQTFRNRLPFLLILFKVAIPLLKICYDL